jgi:hypothetical protein
MTLNLGTGRSFLVMELWQLSLNSGEGARDEDLLGGLEVGREGTLEGGREDLEGPEMEDVRELCRDISCFSLETMISPVYSYSKGLFSRQCFA